MSERVPVDSLSLDPANVRRHPQRNLDAIKASLRRFGQQKPIVVDANNIVRAGNGTLEAARELGWTEIEIKRTELKGSEATAYSIADNRTGELATWDDEALAESLDFLEGEGFEQSELGFENGEAEVLDAALKDFAVPKELPRTSWVLIGVPTLQFAEIAKHIEAIAAVEGVTMETTSNEKYLGSTG